MKFHFYHHHPDHGDRPVTLANHPSASLVIDPHGSCVGNAPPAATHGSQIIHPRARLRQDAPKRTLPPEEAEHPAARHDPTHRLRPRQLFRLSRRHDPDGAIRVDGASPAVCGLTSDSSDDDLRERLAASSSRLDSPKARGARHFSLRKPKLRRYRSLPIQLSSASPVPAPAAAVEAVLPTVPGLELPCGNEAVPAAEAGCAAEDRKLGPRRRHVTFVSIEIREYSTILGDHPYCPTGLPLSLGWDLERESSANIESYEAARWQAGRRSRDELRLGSDTRRGILLGLAAPSQPPGEGAVATRQPLYTRRELERAERRLTRERSANARLSLRQQRKFFQSTPPLQRETDGASMVEGVDEAVRPQKTEAKEEAIGPLPPMEEEVVAMDVSPMKSQTS